MNLKNNVCCKYLLTLLTNLSIEGNSVDSAETAPIGPVWSGSTLFDQEASRTFRQTTKSDNICFFRGLAKC